MRPSVRGSGNQRHRTVKRNLLVTGGAGFIGSNFIREVLAEDDVAKLINVDCLTYAGHLENTQDFQAHSNYVFEQVDIRNKEALSNLVEQYEINGIIHFAAESHVDRSIEGPDAFIHTNILGTYHLLEACRHRWRGQEDRCRFLHVSTDEVYGSLAEDGVFTEETSYDPSSPYSASKAASDHLVRAYHRTYGLPAVITNCSNNFGPYQYPEKLIPVVIRSLQRREPIPIYGDGRNIRDWLFVTDHARAIWKVFREGQLGESYNISAENEWTNIDLVRLICQIYDELSGESESAVSLIQYVTDRPGHDRRYALSSRKIREDLGWQSEFPFRQSLEATVQWYLDHGAWIESVSSGS